MTMIDQNETFYLDQDCRLSDAELASRRDDLAKAIGDHQELLRLKRDETSRMNKELRGLEAKSEDLAQQIRAREEVRPVECRRVMDATKQRVAVIRMDTGVVVDIRDMEPEEVERTQGEPEFFPEPNIQAAIDAFAEQMEGFDLDAETPEEEDEVVDPKDDDEDLVAHLKMIRGLGDAKVSKLRDARVLSVEALLALVPSDLVEVGFTPQLAEEVLVSVQARFGDVEADDNVDDVLGI
jgi:hypothetical protein